MVDQLDSNTRSPVPDAEIDDPLAELARIIGYERPAESGTAVDNEPQSSDFDLEAELMRELDVSQIPAIDELDLLEAEAEAVVDEAIDDGADLNSVEDREADLAGSEDLWADGAPDDAWGARPDEGVSAEALSLARDDDGYPESNATLDPVEPAAAGDTPLHDPWSDEGFAAEAEADLHLDAFEAPQFPDPARNDEGRVVHADFSGAGTMATQRMPDDEVLADMFRFEIPGRDPAGLQSPPAIPEAESQFAEVDSGAPNTELYHEEEFEGALEGLDSLQDEDPAGDVTEPDFASAGHEYLDRPAAELPPVSDANPIAADFEDFLSTELDAFGQNLSAKGYGGHVAVDVADVAGSDHVSDVGEWDYTSPDGDDTVFDEAAEELLADFGGGDLELQHAEAQADAPEDWSVESLEDAIGEELEDMIGLSEPLNGQFEEPAEAADDLDFDLELDLDEVLAETSEEAAADWDAFQNSSAHTAPDDDAAAYVQAPDDEFAGPESDERDEMAAAFLGLIPAEDSHEPEPDHGPEGLVHADQPDPSDALPPQDDWLGGFETSESAEQSAKDDFYFDADLIAEPEISVEAVADIDVPELEHDEPQAAEPDYDTEIEREFAGIVDASDTGSDAGFDASYAASGDWGRGETAERGYEASDDYIALERELGVVASGHSYQETGMRAGEQSVADSARGEFAEEPAQREAGSRGPVLALAVLGLAVLAGAGAFGWSMLSGDENVADDGPRIIRADTEPVKVLPENPGGVTVPNQDKAVYDRVAGGDAASQGQPALVNTAEEPVDVVQRTLDPDVLPLEGRGEVAVKSEERLAAGGSGADTAANAEGAPVVSPRKVRTMIVKPDGSIVAREEIEPVPEPQATAEQPEPEPVATAAAEPAAEATANAEPATAKAELEPPAAEPVTPATELATATDAPSADQSIAPVRVVRTQPIRAPVPQTRPADQPVTVVGTVTQGGNVATQQAPPAAPAQPVEVASAPAVAAPAANPGGYYVQIASQPSEEGAQSSWRTLSSRYNSVIGGRGVDIQRADIPGKGVFHRVRIPAGSRDEANALCTRYKSVGGNCFVSR